MDLEECFRKGLIRKAKPDRELAKSLIEMSGIKETAVKTAAVNKINVSAYVSLAYDSLREVLEEGVEKGLPWYAMSFIEGLTLRRYCREFVWESPDTTSSDVPGGDASGWKQDSHLQSLSHWWTWIFTLMPNPILFVSEISCISVPKNLSAREAPTLLTGPPILRDFIPIYKLHPRHSPTRRRPTFWS
jgi:hypothetical protein